MFQLLLVYCNACCVLILLQRPLCHIHRLSVSCASTSSNYCSCVVMHACVLILLQRPLMCHLHRLSVSCVFQLLLMCCNACCILILLERPLCHIHRLSVSCASTSSNYCSCVVMHACVLILLQRPLMCHLHRLSVSCVFQLLLMCCNACVCFDSSTAPTHVPPSPIVRELR